MLLGIFDYFAPREGIKRDSIKVGRDTSASEFPTHARAFRKFGQIDNVVFVLDGDRRDSDDARKIRDAAGRRVPVYFLPGRKGPEAWVWEQLRQLGDESAAALGINANDLAQRMRRIDAIHNHTSGRSSEIAKHKMATLAERLDRSVSDLCRVFIGVEVKRPDSTVHPLIRDLTDAVNEWRKKD